MLIAEKSLHAERGSSTFAYLQETERLHIIDVFMPNSRLMLIVVKITQSCERAKITISGLQYISWSYFSHGKYGYGDPSTSFEELSRKFENECPTIEFCDKRDSKDDSGDKSDKWTFVQDNLADPIVRINAFNAARLDHGRRRECAHPGNPVEKHIWKRPFRSNFILSPWPITPIKRPLINFLVALPRTECQNPAKTSNSPNFRYVASNASLMDQLNFAMRRK